jgi:hypothetical protein
MHCGNAERKRLPINVKVGAGNPQRTLVGTVECARQSALGIGLDVQLHMQRASQNSGIITGGRRARLREPTPTSKPNQQNNEK